MLQNTFIEWIIIQTEMRNLILYCYLFWYLWIMFACHAAFPLTLSDFRSCLLMSFYVGFALNAAAYHKKGANQKTKENRKSKNKMSNYSSTHIILQTQIETQNDNCNANQLNHNRATRYCLSNIFLIARFFLIPFCVSSMSIACNKSDGCTSFLLPKKQSLCIQQIIFQVTILVLGFILHRYVERRHCT